MCLDSDVDPDVMTASSVTSSDALRKVILRQKLAGSGSFLGFNIRGGAEWGIPVYVSRFAPHHSACHVVRPSVAGIEVF